MTGEVWPADAPDAENKSANGQPSPSSEPRLSLAEAVHALAVAIAEQNNLLTTIVTQNAELISMMVDVDEEAAPRVDLSGNPIS